MDARVPLDDVNDLLGTNWEAEDSDTIGGFVYEQLGRIPNPGDKVQKGNYVITVLSTEGTTNNTAFHSAAAPTPRTRKAKKRKAWTREQRRRRWR